MPPIRKGETLTPRQARFVSEYLVDLNGTQAAIRAGYSPRTANEQAVELLAKPSLALAIQERRQALQQATEITQEWVLRNLRDNFLKAIQAVPVTTKDGEPTGAYTYYPAAANRALELLGKHIGMWPEAGANLNLFVKDGVIKFSIEKAGPPVIEGRVVGDTDRT